MLTRIAALAASLALAVAACNGDDTVAGDGAGGELDRYCDLALQIETLPEPDIDFEATPPEQVREQLKTYAVDEVQPLTTQLQEVAPEETREEIDVLVDAVNRLGETGEFSIFEEPAVLEAQRASHEFDLSECGWEAIDVTGVDYAFEGLPAELDAGVASFEFANEGQEPHELVIFRINDDVQETLQEILQLPEEEAMTKVVPVGGTFAEPGESDAYKVLELEPGRYGIVCFIPVGGGEEGPPHFTEGMLAEVTVS